MCSIIHEKLLTVHEKLVFIREYALKHHEKFEYIREYHKQTLVNLYAIQEFCKLLH
jgi:hypothetical protein